MKYYSEKLKKPFDTEEDCVKAEKEFDKEQKRIQEELDKAIAAKKAEDEKLNASKKELAKVIEAAQAELDEAKSIHEAAKQKADEIMAEAKQKAAEVINAASVKVREASQKKYEAVKAFTNKFGPYTISLTGDKAAKEFNEVIKGINDMFYDALKGVLPGYYGNYGNFWIDKGWRI